MRINKGTLSVIKINNAMYTVECECGNIFKQYKCRFDVSTGGGCRLCIRKRTGLDNPRTTHGGNNIHKKEYNSWRAMIERCNSPKYHAYHRYGGRGIKVCEQWSSKDGFANFLSDMGQKPTAKHSIDRIDSNGNYEPSNCKWSTQKEQMSHMSRTRLETINGITKTASEWCQSYSMPTASVYNRMRLGWTFEEAVMTPMYNLGTNQFS